MAFVQSPLPDEQQNKLGQSGTTTPNPLSLLPPQAAQTGGSAGSGGGAQAGSAPSVGTSTQFGSNASRLSDYLSANKDQVQGMANNIAGGLGSQYQGVKGNIDQAGQNFANTVQQGFTPYNKDVISGVSNDPTNFAKDPNNVKAFQGQLNDKYTGPSSFEGSQQYGGVQEGITNAVQQAGLLNSPAGLSTYLQNNIENNATPGQNTLDTVLLQGNQPAYQQVQDAAKPFSGLQDYLKSIGQPLNQSVQAAQAAAPMAAQEAQAALSGRTSGLSNAINTGVTGAEAQRTAYNKSLSDFLGNVSSGDQFLDQLAQGAGKSRSAYAPSVRDTYFPIISANSPLNTPISASNYATPEQYAEASALQQLSGNNLTGLPISQDTLSQAGTAPKIPGTQFPSYQEIMDLISSWTGGGQTRGITDPTNPNPQPLGGQPPTPPPPIGITDPSHPYSLG